MRQPTTIEPGATDQADISTVFGSNKSFQLTIFFDNRLAKAGAGDNQAYRLTYALKSGSAADHDQQQPDHPHIAFLYNLFLDRFIAGFTVGAVKG